VAGQQNIYLLWDKSLYCIIDQESGFHASALPRRQQKNRQGEVQEEIEESKNCSNDNVGKR